MNTIETDDKLFGKIASQRMRLVKVELYEFWKKYFQNLVANAKNI